jgi:hypothetical protein
MDAQATTRTKFSIPSLIAIAAAIASFATGAMWGFILAMVAVVFGAIGLVLALSPRVRGGIVSFVGVIGGLLGLLAAIIKGAAWLL